MEACVVQDLEEKDSALAEEIERVQAAVAELETLYSEFTKIREVLDNAFIEESNAQFRIANEFETLRESVKRINYELVYIKEERQKIKQKLRQEYTPVPMPELLACDESYNSAWSDLVGNTRLVQFGM